MRSRQRAIFDCYYRAMPKRLRLGTFFAITTVAFTGALAACGSDTASRNGPSDLSNSQDASTDPTTTTPVDEDAGTGPGLNFADSSLNIPSMSDSALGNGSADGCAA